MAQGEAGNVFRRRIRALRWRWWRTSCATLGNPRALFHGILRPSMAKAGEPIDIRERGGGDQASDRRLYMQLQAYTGARSLEGVIERFRASGLEGVVYADAVDPLGFAVLTISEDPAVFVGAARELFAGEPFASMVRRPEFAMFGRTYGTGREPQLEFALLTKPRETARNPGWPWAVWYPLRRKAGFARLPPERQGKILHEHALIGMEYGRADLAHDIRLACYGLDRKDNEFVIGLVGRELYPLSRLVQEMRRTEQTAEWIESLGPFFVGRAVYQG